MKLITVPIDELERGKSNVRKAHSKEAIKTMANSIRHRGLINPICVRKNGGDHYEIVAGYLRSLGAKEAGLTEIEARDVSDLDEAQLIELSLSENIDRKQMTPIQLYRAMTQLYIAGRSEAEIATRFMTTERVVKQHLAIGGLPTKVLNMAERGEIFEDLLPILAIVDKATVKAFASLPKDERPKAEWQLRRWLKADGDWFYEKDAIFDLEQYDGGRVVDIFNEDKVQLTDGPQFLRLQEQAIEDQVAKYEAKNIKVTRVDYFQSWKYDKVAMKDGGEVFYTFSDSSGRVEWYKGYAPQKKAKKSVESATHKNETQPETTKAFDEFVAQWRHAYLCEEIATNDKSMLVALICLLGGQAGNFNIVARTPKLSDKYKEALDDLPSNRKVCGVNVAVAKKGKFDQFPVNIEEMAQTLASKQTNTLMAILRGIVASEYDLETWNNNSDVIARAIGLECVDTFKPNDVFWSGITNKQTLLEIGKEFGLKLDEQATAKALRKTVAEAAPEGWMPKWMQY